MTQSWAGCVVSRWKFASVVGRRRRRVVAGTTPLIIAAAEFPIARRHGRYLRADACCGISFARHYRGCRYQRGNPFLGPPSMPMMMRRRRTASWKVGRRLSLSALTTTTTMHRVLRPASACLVGRRPVGEVDSSTFYRLCCTISGLAKALNR